MMSEKLGISTSKGFHEGRKLFWEGEVVVGNKDVLALTKQLPVDWDKFLVFEVIDVTGVKRTMPVRIPKSLVSDLTPTPMIRIPLHEGVDLMALFEIIELPYSTTHSLYFDLTGSNVTEETTVTVTKIYEEN